LASTYAIAVYGIQQVQVDVTVSNDGLQLSSRYYCKRETENELATYAILAVTG